MISKKYLQLTIISAVLATLPCYAKSTILDSQNSFTVSQFSGDGKFDLMLKVMAPVTSFEFDYGTNDYKLNDWGVITSSNANVIVKDLENGLYHYTVTPLDPNKPFQPVSNQITIPQIPLLTATILPKNMSFAGYYGLFQNIKINGAAVNYADACQGSACQDPLPGKIAGGYYADWSVYLSSGTYKPQYVDFSRINRLYYAFGALHQQTGDALLFDPYADVTMANVNAVPYFALQRLAHPYLTLSYSYGGWGSPKDGNYQSGDMSILFQYYPENIANAANTLITAMNRTGFNAIDIDYEWAGPQNPTPLDGHKPLDPVLTQEKADGYVTLLYLIRHHAGLPNDFKLTVALPAGKPSIEDLANFKYQGAITEIRGQSDLKIVADNVDTIDLMTYDYHGSFDAAQPPTPYSVTDFLAPMNTAAGDPTNNDPVLKTFTVQGSVQALKDNLPGISNQKIVIGVPAYGRLEQVADNLVNATNRGVYLTLAADQSDAAGELGNTVVNYNCLMHAKDCIASYALPTDMMFVLGPFINNLDPIGQAVQTAWAYSISKNKFISFDSAATAKNKGQWIKQQGFAGSMIWELDGDLNGVVDPDYISNSVVANVFEGLR